MEGRRQSANGSKATSSVGKSSGGFRDVPQRNSKPASRSSSVNSAAFSRGPSEKGSAVRSAAPTKKSTSTTSAAPSSKVSSVGSAVRDRSSAAKKSEPQHETASAASSKYHQSNLISSLRGGRDSVASSGTVSTNSSFNSKPVYTQQTSERGGTSTRDQYLDLHDSLLIDAEMRELSQSTHTDELVLSSGRRSERKAKESVTAPPAKRRKSSTGPPRFLSAERPQRKASYVPKDPVADVPPAEMERLRHLPTQQQRSDSIHYKNTRSFSGGGGGGGGLVATVDLPGPGTSRLDLNREEDVKEYYKQRYLVDPTLVTRPGKKQFHVEPQVDLFGMYHLNDTPVDPNEITSSGRRGSVPHNEGVKTVLSGSDTPDNEGVLSRFVHSGETPPPRPRHVSLTDDSPAETATPNRDSLNLFTPWADTPSGEAQTTHVGRGAVKSASQASHLTTGLRPTEDDSPHAAVRSLEKIKQQYANQPDNDWAPTVKSVQTRLFNGEENNAAQDSDIFGVSGRIAGMVRRCEKESVSPHRRRSSAPFGEEDDTADDTGYRLGLSPGPKRTVEPREEPFQSYSDDEDDEVVEAPAPVEVPQETRRGQMGKRRSLEPAGPAQPKSREEELQTRFTVKSRSRSLNTNPSRNNSRASSADIPAGSSKPGTKRKPSSAYDSSQVSGLMKWK
ncbi:hypothetical protein AGDE_16013 [Angomonas deanei]|nr:hypothetical protein AGDE_16013 [Angomonas deanei]|eukprot:EPY17902.1 hypothetical protein AGDE_16013 [Angomonas deanei]